MRKPYQRGIAMAGSVLLGLAVAGCGAQDAGSEETTAAATQAAASEATASESATSEATTDPDSTEVESIDVMVEKLQKKNYSCKEWKQTDDVQGADASGTCNGKDQVMWFADAAKVDAKKSELDGAGTGYVFGDNWIVANTVTPTLVRNALDGTAVAAK